MEIWIRAGPVLRCFGRLPSRAALPPESPSRSPSAAITWTSRAFAPRCSSGSCSRTSSPGSWPGGAVRRAASGRSWSRRASRPSCPPSSGRTNALPYTIGLLFDLLPAVIFLHVFLAFPSGRLERRPERWLVGVGYFVAVGFQLAKMLLGGGRPGQPRWGRHGDRGRQHGRGRPAHHPQRDPPGRHRAPGHPPSRSACARCVPRYVAAGRLIRPRARRAWRCCSWPAPLRGRRSPRSSGSRSASSASRPSPS